MKLILIVSTLASAAFVPNHLARRQKDFVTYHQEHGHLPGGANNPGPGAIIPQMMRIMSGESIGNVLNSYSQAADANSQ